MCAANKHLVFNIHNIVKVNVLYYCYMLYAANEYFDICDEFAAVIFIYRDGEGTYITSTLGEALTRFQGGGYQFFIYILFIIY